MRDLTDDLCKLSGDAGIGPHDGQRVSKHLSFLLGEVALRRIVTIQFFLEGILRLLVRRVENNQVDHANDVPLQLHPRLPDSDAFDADAPDVVEPL